MLNTFQNSASVLSIGFFFTVITLGLFLFVINALMFYWAAALLDGFQVRGFGAALIGSLVYTLLGMLIHSVLERLFPQQ